MSYLIILIAKQEICITTTHFFVCFIHNQYASISQPWSIVPGFFIYFPMSLYVQWEYFYFCTHVTLFSIVEKNILAILIIIKNILILANSNGFIHIIQYFCSFWNAYEVVLRIDIWSTMTKYNTYTPNFGYFEHYFLYTSI
jgi:hypothetical protein